MKRFLDAKRIILILGLTGLAGAGQARFYQQFTSTEEMDPQLALIGPSRVEVGQPLELHLVSRGQDGEPAGMVPAPTVRCEGPGSFSSSERSSSFFIDFEPVGVGIYKPVAPPTLTQEGYYLLTALDPGGKHLPFGLPVQVLAEAPELDLHWGDLHGHSMLSDGARPPEEYYRWARDVARLDMMALADHNWALNPEKLEKIRLLSTEWYEPGRFVPFFAFEWAMGERRPAPAEGRPHHKHLIFRRTDDRFDAWSVWEDFPSDKNLWEMLEGREVIAVPHHTGLPHETHFGTDWSAHDARFERLAEIFSDWGSSEFPEDRYPLPRIERGNFICDALRLGMHLGFCGGSDTHTSRPGLNALPHQGHPYALTSLTAVEASRRLRDDLWIALYNRRCYAASTGRRPLLEFSVDGAPMGARIVQPVVLAPRRVTATIVGSTHIREILIVKNSEPVAAFPGDGWCQRMEWTDDQPSPDREDSYYVRAEMEDTSMAWSSPIWVAGPADSDIAAGPRSWRLDGDVSVRRLRMESAEGFNISAQRPLTLCQVEGAGALDRISLNALVGDSEEDLRSAVLSVWIDGEESPAIETSVDPFFFVAMGGKPFSTRGVGFTSVNEENGRRLTFVRDLRIPFARSCRVELRPPSSKILPHVRSQITWGRWPDGKLPPLGRMGRCVVRSLRGFEVEGTGTEVEILNLQGRGFLHSLHLAMRNPDAPGQYMEGNMEIYVDGETKPSYASSGTEEFFFGGIYFINPFWTPDGGCTLSIFDPDNPDHTSSAYRVFAKDPIVFDKSLRILWHNGQQGQGEVPGTTVVDAQSVVYLQREDDRPADDSVVSPASLAQRLSLLDGDPELGPMVAETAPFGPIRPGDTATLASLTGAGHLNRIQLCLSGEAERLSRALLKIKRDGETLCDEPLAVLFGTGGIALDFTSTVTGQTASLSGKTHLQRALVVPYQKSLTIQLVATEDCGPVEGLAVIERRKARGGLPSDFGPAQSPLLDYGSCTVGVKAKTHPLVSIRSREGGQVREISLRLSGLPSEVGEIPGRLILECDGDPAAVWTPETLVAGLDDRTPGAHVNPEAICLRDEGIWSALISLGDLPFSFDKTARLRFDSAGLPQGVKVEAHLLFGRAERGAKRTSCAEEIAQRLTALDGGVLAGRAICRSVLENGDINPGESATLLDLAGHGTLRCLRIGTPGSAIALRRSHLSITPSGARSEPTVNTTTDHLFATWFDPFPFWEGAEWMVRPTQLYREELGHHTSAFRLLNLPFDGRCRVVLSAPEDEAGVMEWIKKNRPGETPRQVLQGQQEIPESIRRALLQCGDFGLFVQVYANRVDRALDWGRWATPRFFSIEGDELHPGGEITLADVTGRGALQGLQMAFENPVSRAFEHCSIEAYVDGESTPSWVASSPAALFLGTPIPDSGEGKQTWEDPSSRGRNARGAGHRLMSPEAGTTILTASAPYRLGGLRRFTRDAVTFEQSLRIICRAPTAGDAPTRVWSLVLLSTEQ